MHDQREVVSTSRDAKGDELYSKHAIPVQQRRFRSICCIHKSQPPKPPNIDAESKRNSEIETNEFETIILWRVWSSLETLEVDVHE